MAKLDLIKKERTVYGYDILEAVHTAFELSEKSGKTGNEFDITKTIIMSLMDDVLYEKLHILAKSNHEKAMKVFEAFDKIIKSVKEIIDE